MPTSDNDYPYQFLGCLASRRQVIDMTSWSGSSTYGSVESRTCAAAFSTGSCMSTLDAYGFLQQGVLANVDVCTMKP